MFEDPLAVPGPISQRSRWTPRTLEAYLQAGGRPRWMDRIGEIEAYMAMARHRIQRADRLLAREAGDDVAELERRRAEFAESFDFGQINELITQHNDWYPIERDLPMDPRTGDYVLVHGRSYRRQLLGPDWVLEQFRAA